MSWWRVLKDWDGSEANLWTSSQDENSEIYPAAQASSPIDNRNRHKWIIIDFRSGNIDVEKLKAEKYMISDYIKSVTNMKQMTINQISNISTICVLIEIVRSINGFRRKFDVLRNRTSFVSNQEQGFRP